MSDQPKIEPMGDTYTQAEARGWHENAKQWQEHCNGLRQQLEVANGNSGRRYYALQEILTILDWNVDEDWAIDAIRMLATNAQLEVPVMRWEQAMQAVMQNRRVRAVADAAEKEGK